MSRSKDVADLLRNYIGNMEFNARQNEAYSNFTRPHGWFENEAAFNFNMGRLAAYKEIVSLLEPVQQEPPLPQTNREAE